MTKAQTMLYFREWAAVRAACRAAALPEPDRHELHRRALGEDKSSKLFTNADFDRVLAEFRAISRPASVDAQIRQQTQPTARRNHKLEDTLACLALYVPDPIAYAREIIRDMFNRGSRRQVSEIEDLSDTPRTYIDAENRLVEMQSQLTQLLMTLERALNGREGFRNQSGETLHAMKVRARVRCVCKSCRLRRLYAGRAPVLPGSSPGVGKGGEVPR